jgi:tripartite-type tricarboxylate transporter receptor subunit TctC
VRYAREVHDQSKEGNAMSRRCRRFRGLAGVAALGMLLLALADHAAWSQSARTLKIVVASQPGGVNDILARLLSEQIARVHGVTGVVDNRPGAGEAIGTESVARAAPDGNTLLIAANPFLINPHMRKVSYHPLTSFEPICYLVSAPTVIAVNGTSSYRSLAELIEAARVRPGGLSMASIGPGSPFHLGLEVLKRAAKVDITFVPYPGNAPAVNALLGEHVTMMFGTYANVAEHLKSGKLRALAATTRVRIESLPELRTVAEFGFKDVEVDAWFGMFAPAGTPRASVAQLAGWFTGAMQAPDVAARLAVLGLSRVGMCGADFAAHLRHQFDDYGRIIREANIKGE